MHIEPGIVTGTKMVLSYATAAGAAGIGLKMAAEALRASGAAALILRSTLTTALVFCFFQVLPHYPVGVSEVHFILGSTLFLLFGAGPAAIGLTLGLLAQGVLVAPLDLPQYFVNVTTLLLPLFAMAALARRIIEPGTAYVDLTYAQVLSLSAAYQGGIVAWVAFWALYGQGLGAETLAAIASFAAAYALVIVIEPLVDLTLLGAAKSLRGPQASPLFAPRLFGSG